MDLTKLSDQDLIALKENRVQDISDNGLLILAGKEPKQKVVSKYDYDPALVGQPTDEQMAGGAEAQAEFRRVGGQALKNLPKSTLNLAKGVVESVLSPVDTVTNIVQLGYGVLQAIDPTGMLPKDEKSSQLAKQVGDFYVQRYGSVEGAKKAIAEDPAGVLADVSSILYGGGALLKAAPLTREIGVAAQQAGRMTDPLLQSFKAGKSVVTGAGKYVPDVLGITTGAGGESFRQAFQAGKEGGKREALFRENISGVADPVDIVEAAKRNLNVMRDQRSNAYRSGMVDISKDQTVLKFDGIDQAVVDAEKRTKYGSKVIDKSAYEALQDVKQIINEWKKSNPDVYHTPEGMDALKQSIGAILDGLDINKNPYNTVNNVYKSVKSEIVKQAPVYANTMKEYAQATDQIREIEKALSLGDKASVDTAVRKLMSLMRDNVQTNYGQRVKLGRQLEAVGGEPVLAGIAGQALKSPVPRGLQAASTLPTGGISYLAGGAPAAIASLLTSSPRLMGETAYRAGQVSRAMDRVGQTAPFILSPELYNLLAQAGRNRE